VKKLIVLLSTLVLVAGLGAYNLQIITLDFGRRAPEDELRLTFPGQEELRNEESTTAAEATDLSNTFNTDVPNETGAEVESGGSSVGLPLGDSPGVYREYMAAVRERARAEHGLPAPIYPYRHRLESLQKLIEQEGFTREELFPAFREFVTETATRAPGSGKTPVTEKLSAWFQNNDAAAIEGWIAERLKLDATDIIAHLVELDLHRSQHDFERFYDKLEEMMPYVAGFQCEFIDRKVLLSYILEMGEIWAYSTQSFVEDYRSRTQDQLGFSTAFIVRALEWLCMS